MRGSKGVFECAPLAPPIFECAPLAGRNTRGAQKRRVFEWRPLEALLNRERGIEWWR